MQSIIDIGSNARSRGQANRQINKRCQQEKERQIKQAQSQNASASTFKIQKSKHRYRPRFSSAEKVDIFIQKQSVIRHSLPQYSFDGRFDARPDLSFACSWNAIPLFTARPTFDIFRINKPLTQRQKEDVFRMQKAQWDYRNANLKFIAKDAIDDLIAIIREKGCKQMKSALIDDIRTQITHISEPIERQYNEDYSSYVMGPRHTDNAKLR